MIWIQYLLIISPVFTLISSQKLCLTTSPTGGLLFRVNETLEDEVPNVVLNMTGEIYGEEDEIRLKLVENPNGYFRLSGQTLVLIQPIDRDETDMNILKLKLSCSFYDDDGSPFEREIRITVLIDDLNDNPPQFVNTPYSVNISESTKVGEIIFSGMEAYDIDKGPNSHLTFDIANNTGQPANISEYFSIPDRLKGNIILKKPLDFESFEKYNLVVEAKDNPIGRTKRQSSMIGLSMNVLNENDSPPSFVHSRCRGFRGICQDVDYRAVVRAATSPASVPLNIEPNPILATDRDNMNSIIHYSFINGTPATYSQYFSLDSRAGTLTQIRSIPYGEAKRYVIQVKAEKLNQPQLYSLARVTIEVDDRVRNDFDPVLQVSALEGYIAENAQIGATVRISQNPESDSLQILVSDDDLKPGMSPASYQYILTGLGASVFAVNQGGFVYLNVPKLDADEPNPAVYSLTIQAREVGTQPVRSSKPVGLTINVIDVNDNGPQFPSAIYSAFVSSENPGLREVIRVRANDLDSGPFGELQYRIKSVSNGGRDLFRYNQDKNLLMAIGRLISGQQYQVILEAVDGGGRASQTVIMVNTPPPSDANMSGNLISNPFGPQIQPSRQGPNGPPGSVRPRPRSGVNRPLQQPRPRISDDRGQYTASVSEATPTNTVVVSLAENNPPGSVRYTIQQGNDEGKFKIDPMTGTVSTAGNFDRETRQRYRLVVEKTFVRGGASNSSVIIVEVEDMNDNAPIFSQKQPITFQAPAGVPNLAIGKIQVSDPDEDKNGQITLFMDPPEARALFTFDPMGNIRTRGGLPNNRNSYQLTVIARDGGQPQLESQALVNINVIRTTSPGPGNNQLGPFNQPNNNNNNNNNNQITQARTFRPTIPLTSPRPPFIQYSTMNSQTRMQNLGQNQNQGFTSPTASRTIPFFVTSAYEVEVDEGSGPTELMNLVATASDNGPITYILQQGDPTLFSIDSVTGRLRTISDLDAEQAKTHTIIVSTREASTNQNSRPPPRGSPTANINVIVRDVNDWKPVFEPESYEATVASNANPGIPLVQVSAIDQDVQPPNNVIRYQMAPEGEYQGYFRIDPRSGLVSVSRSIQGIQANRFKITVQAIDGGQPNLISDATILVDVEEVMTPSPSVINNQAESDIKFTLPQYTISVSEGVKSPFFIQVLPVTNKPPNSGAVQCNIVSGNFGRAFSLTTGSNGNCELRTANRLDRETTERYLLNASISGLSLNGQRSIDFASVSVTVLDSNDNGPEFTYNYDQMGLTAYFGAIAADAPPFTRVLTVQAKDKDLGDNSVIRYTLDPLTSDGQYFKVNEDSGEIQNAKTLSGMLGRRPPYFRFRVDARDNPSDGRSILSKADIVVNLITGANRFLMTAEGILPDQLEKYIPNMQSILQTRTEPCTVLGVEKMVESAELAAVDKPGTDVWWYAINPSTMSICTRDDFSGLFAESNQQLMRGQMSAWFEMRELKKNVPVVARSGVLGQQKWQAAPIALIVLACIVAVGALLAIFAMCYFWTRYKASRTIVSDKALLYGALPKYNALILPPSEKEYETQMLEMAVAEDDGYVNKNRDGVDIDFTVHEGIYSIQQGGRLDPYHS